MANIDLEMGQFQKVTTLGNKDYIVVSLDNGTQGQIKVSDLASVVAANIRKITNLGDSIATSGNIWFQDNYTSGKLVNVGQIKAYGYLYIGYGIECRDSKYYSSSGINIIRFVVIFATEGIRFGTSPLGEIPIGTEVSLDFKTISK